MLKISKSVFGKTFYSNLQLILCTSVSRAEINNPSIYRLRPTETERWPRLSDENFKIQTEAQYRPYSANSRYSAWNHTANCPYPAALSQRNAFYNPEVSDYFKF